MTQATQVLPGNSSAWLKEKYQLMLLLPLQDNDGQSLLVERAAVKEEVFQIVGGYTELPQGVGAWWDNNTNEAMYDDVYPLLISFDADRTDILDTLRDRIRPWCDMLRQHSLYCVLTKIVDISQASSEALETYDAVTA